MCIRDSPQIEREGLSFSFVDTDCMPGHSCKYRIDYETLDTPRMTLFETEIMDIPELQVTLGQNYPNPFNPSTAIEYYVPEKNWVTLSIYNVAGKHIAQLVEDSREQGFYVARWQGVDDQGHSVASGIYFCRLRVGKEIVSKKIVLMR